MKENKEGQPLLDVTFALYSHRAGSALLFHAQFLSSLWWEHLALIPPCAHKLGFPQWGACCLFGCAYNPQTPPASLYQHSSTTKTTPKPNHIPSPSNQLQARWMPQLTLSRLSVTRLLSWFDFWVSCVTLQKGFHHHCVSGHASLTWVLHPYSAAIQETQPCEVWQQTEMQHQHLVKSKISYPYNVIWIVPEV